MKIEIDVPNQILPRVVDALCDHFQYDPDSGIPKGEFARQKVAQMVADIVMNNETTQELKKARLIAEQKALDIHIT